MRLTRRSTDLLSLIGMIVLLLAATFFDDLVNKLRSAPILDMTPRRLYLWLVPFAFLVLAVGLLLLFWFTFHQEKRNIYISVFFIVIGIGLSFFPTLHYGLGWGPRIPLFMD